MRKLADQVVCTRTLPTVDAAARRGVEEALERETKRPASATQVGAVFGCADERGLNVLLTPRAGGGAELTVNDLALSQSSLLAVAAFMALGALVLVALSLWSGSFGYTVSAVLFALFAAGFQAGTRLDRWRRRRRVERVADAMASAVAARVRVEVEPETATHQDDAVEQVERSAGVAHAE